MIGGDPWRSGTSNLATELCTVTRETVICNTQDPMLQNQRYYPELFIVDQNFCQHTIISPSQTDQLLTQFEHTMTTV